MRAMEMTTVVNNDTGGRNCDRVLVTGTGLVDGSGGGGGIVSNGGVYQVV